MQPAAELDLPTTSPIGSAAAPPTPASSNSKAAWLTLSLLCGGPNIELGLPFGCRLLRIIDLMVDLEQKSCRRRRRGRRLPLSLSGESVIIAFGVCRMPMFTEDSPAEDSPTSLPARWERGVLNTLM